MSLYGSVCLHESLNVQTNLRVFHTLLGNLIPGCNHNAQQGIIYSNFFHNRSFLHVIYRDPKAASYKLLINSYPGFEEAGLFWQDGNQTIVK